MAKEPNKASDQGKAGAGAEREQGANAAELNDKRAAKNEQQVHAVTREVIHDGEVYVAGDGIALTRQQHAQLFAVGAVAEDWRD